VAGQQPQLAAVLGGALAELGPAVGNPLADSRLCYGCPTSFLAAARRRDR
jgi:hypothetical protein